MMRKQGIAQEVENRPLLLATGFNRDQDVFHKSTVQIGLRPVRITLPDDWMPKHLFSTVVRWLKTECRDKLVGGGTFAIGAVFARKLAEKHAC